jgi:hypothetical protein
VQSSEEEVSGVSDGAVVARLGQRRAPIALGESESEQEDEGRMEEEDMMMDGEEDNEDAEQEGEENNDDEDEGEGSRRAGSAGHIVDAESDEDEEGKDDEEDGNSLAEKMEEMWNEVVRDLARQANAYLYIE